MKIERIFLDENIKVLKAYCCLTN